MHTQSDRVKALEEVQQQLRLVLAAIYDCNVDEIHIHNVRRDTAALARLQKRETKSGQLSRSDVDELIPNMVWIHEWGIHLGLLSEKGQNKPTLVFAVKISAWETMQQATSTEIQKTLQVVMDYGDHMNQITNNAAANYPPSTADPNQHGVRDRNRKPSTKKDSLLKKPLGKMYAVGWHASFETNKTLVSYAPNANTEESLAAFRDLNTKLPKVAALYRHGLACLFPGGAARSQEVADKDGNDHFNSFINALTVTKEQFSNYQHIDKDHYPVAFGYWWEAVQVDGRWIFCSNVDHNKTRGGEFIWGPMEARGMVEIFWRGLLDFHGTLKSIDDAGFTRFGTSIQITARGVNAMRKVWNVEQLANAAHNVHNLAPKLAARITTPQDRIDTIQDRLAAKKRKTAA
ncbi:hypothetical protein GGX14DRAFT_428355 [Mycena pura]|uniref:Tet-like 2OG-Fe(II) oxygenase domain-containing protein n=1 Tax=Mycena pura TaxID=153505 RepID=A0AAD6YJL5_9AGAR|nr:hypothetical protein GGX14DRAFT_428355 [Mycena pura]